MRPIHVLLLALVALGVLYFTLFSSNKGSSGPITPVVGPVEEVAPVQPKTSTSELANVTGTGANRVAGGIEGASEDEGPIQYDNKLVGTVKNASGQALEGAEVLLTTLGASEIFFVNDPLPDLSREPRSRTDAEGRFSFPGIVPRERYTLVVSHPKYARKEVPTVPVFDQGVFEEPPIVLVLGARLSGYVKDEGGNFIDDAVLWLDGVQYQGLGIDAPDRMQQKSNKEGWYEFLNVPRGQRTLTVSAAGYGQITIPGLSFDKEESLQRDITLKIGEQICGRVTGPGGVGVPGATVIAVGVSATQQSARGQVAAKENGEFCLEGLMPGSYNIVASAKGWRAVPGGRNRVESNSTGVILEMFKEAAVKGRVVDAQTGENVSGANVRLRFWYGPESPTQPLSEEWTASPGPEFTIEAAPPADGYVVEAVAPGYAPSHSSNFMVQAGKDVEGIVVRLRRGGSITGRIVDPDGKPVARARVVSHESDWTDDVFTQALGFTYPTNATTAEARTNDQGVFTLRSLTAENYMIDIQAAGYTRAMKRELRVLDGVPLDVGEIRLARGGQVRGTVFDAAGKPLTAASVSLRPVDHDMPSSYSTKSAGDGRFSFGSVVPGRYTLSAVRPVAGGEANPFALLGDESSSAIELVVSEGGTVTQDLNLSE